VRAEKTSDKAKAAINTAMLPNKTSSFLIKDIVPGLVGGIDCES
jgi:hypothetical protein